MPKFASALAALVDKRGRGEGSYAASIYWDVRVIGI